MIPSSSTSYEHVHDGLWLFIFIIVS